MLENLFLLDKTPGWRILKTSETKHDKNVSRFLLKESTFYIEDDELYCNAKKDILHKLES